MCDTQTASVKHRFEKIIRKCSPGDYEARRVVTAGLSDFAAQPRIRHGAFSDCELRSFLADESPFPH